MTAVGEARKERGMQRAWDNADSVWKETALLAFLHLAATRTTEFQCYDVQGMRGVGEPAKHNSWGSVPKIASSPHRGWVVTDGRAVKSNRPETNRSRLLAWTGTDKARADHVPDLCPWCLFGEVA